MRRPQPLLLEATSVAAASGRRAHGFTLIELMVVILILAILTGLSVPLFAQFTRNQRIKTATSELTYALTLARGEALKRNVDVVVAADADGDGWELGWTVTTTDLDGNEIVLMSYAAPAYDDGGDRVAYLTITGPDEVTFTGVGRLAAPVGAFEIESAEGPSDGAKTRCITLDLSGLPRTRVSTTGGC